MVLYCSHGRSTRTPYKKFTIFVERWRKIKTTYAVGKTTFSKHQKSLVIPFDRGAYSRPFQRIQNRDWSTGKIIPLSDVPWHYFLLQAELSADNNRCAREQCQLHYTKIQYTKNTL